MDPHVRDIRYFLAVAEELHFTRAAERLYVSQPALSKQIRMLERSLGTALFKRDARQVCLTSEGVALVPYARSVLESWDAGVAAVDATAQTRHSTLVVGMSTSLGRDGLLPAIRSRFSEQLPSVALKLHQVGWDDPTAGLGDESTDVAFVWLPLPDDHRYRFIVIVEEPCLVALPDTHPLACLTSVNFIDLLDEPFLALPQSAGPLRDYWLATDHRDGRAPLIAAEIATADETYESLVSGLGICLIASGNAPSLTRGGVVTRRVNGLPPCQLAVAWRRDNQTMAIRTYADAAASVSEQINTKPTLT